MRKDWSRQVKAVDGTLVIKYDGSGKSDSNPPGSDDGPDEVTRPAGQKCATIIYTAVGGKLALEGILMCDGRDPPAGLDSALSDDGKKLILTDAAGVGDWHYRIVGKLDAGAIQSADPVIHNLAQAD